MKISVLLPDLRGGGAERVSLDLAQAFGAAGHEIEFVLMSADGELLPEACQHFSIVDLRARNIRHIPIRLWRYLRENRTDVLIANMWPLTSAAVISKRLARSSCRLLLVDHNAVSKQYESWGRLQNVLLRNSMCATYRLAEYVAGVSEGVAADVELLAGFSPGRVAVLHNPIPLREFPREDARSGAEVLWDCPKGQRILTVGSLKDQKNHRLLLRAFSQASQSNSTLMLLGKGVNENMLRALAQELDIAARVIFAGFHADPSPFYATADLFVLSSDYEGFGNVIVEALSFGLPVVSTNCPSGPAEILENGRWGRLTPVGDAAALARAMDEALSTPVDREALKRRAADFSPEIAARKYLDLLGLS